MASQSWTRTRMVACVALLTAASPAFANAGTALLWAGLFHTVFLNALIAGIEIGIIRIALPIGPARRRLGGFVLAANYVAWIVGVVCLSLVVQGLEGVVLGDDPLRRLPWLMAATYVAAFLLTLVLEWPLVLWALKPREEHEPSPNRRRAFRYFLAANVLTYALLAWYYSSVSRVTALTQVRPATDLSFVQTKSAEVFYKPVAGQGLVVQRLDGTPARRVAHTWEQLHRSLEARQPEVRRSRYLWAADLRPEPAPPGSRVWADVSAAGGISLSVGHRSRARWALEAPFFFWYSHWATVLPGDQVVYQFGKYVVVLDPNTRQMAVLARGSRPLVVLGDTESSPAAQEAPVSPKANTPPTNADP